MHNLCRHRNSVWTIVTNDVISTSLQKTIGSVASKTTAGRSPIKLFFVANAIKIG